MGTANALNGLLLAACAAYGTRYTPDWPSLDSRPLPSWYDEAKIGIFMHWGPYSVPGVGSEWFWYQWNRNDPNNPGDVEINRYMKTFYSPGFRYQEFGPEFRAEFFNATEWANLVAQSGAKYFVFTSKHHDGFAMWDTARSFGWNSMDVGPKRDVVGELAKAFQADNRVRFGLYHSLFEWYHPLYLQDKAVNFSTRHFVTEKMGPELMEIILKYQPQVLWSDGEWEAPSSYWGAEAFLAWLYSESPVKDTVVTNDRWGAGDLCKHGDFYTCTDRYNPGVLQKHKWENAMTIDRESWGYRRNMELADILSMGELLETLITTVSCGGNLLMNLGPTSQGTIDPIFQERLREMGEWLAVNGEAIYSTVPWSNQNDTLNSKVWYTSRAGDTSGVIVYGLLLEWPQSNQVELGSTEAGQGTKVTILGGDGEELDWQVGAEGKMIIQLPVRSSINSNYAWTLRLENLDNAGNALW